MVYLLIPQSPEQHWVVVLLACEAGACIAASPFFGYVADQSKSRQLPFLGGLVLLATSMIILTVARSTSVYIIGRLLQGASTAMVDVAGTALVVDTVAAGALGKMLGYLGAATSLGFACGPLAGGVVYHAAGYYAVFGLAFAIIALDLLLRLAMIDPRTAQRWKGKALASQETPLLAQSPVHALWSSERGHGEFYTFSTLLEQPRILIALWGTVVQASVIAAFDTVCFSSCHNTYIIRLTECRRRCLYTWRKSLVGIHLELV